MSDALRNPFILPDAARFSYGRIDEDHLAIIAHLNELADALVTGIDPRELAAKCVVYQSKMTDHFEAEEREMDATGYPRLPYHRRLHDDIRARLSDLVAPLAAGATASVKDVEELFAIIVEDIMQGDLDFKNHLEDLGLAAE